MSERVHTALLTAAPKAPAQMAPPQRRSATVPPGVHAALRTSGQPLTPDTRSLMADRLGHDFSLVRVHTGPEAAASAAALGARAYTAGSDVVFANGAYAPGTKAGQRLLAHELVHVVQQGQTPSVGGGIGASGNRFEQEADRAAAEAVAGQRAQVTAGSSGLFLQCQDDDDPRRFRLQSSLFPDLGNSPRLQSNPSLTPPSLIAPRVMPPTQLALGAGPLHFPSLQSGGNGLPQPIVRPLAALSPLQLTRPQLSTFATAPLPPSLLLTINGAPAGGPGAGPRANPGGGLALTPPGGQASASPAAPTLGMRGETTTDVGTDISLGSGQPAIEVYASMVLQADAAHFGGGRFDLLHQPTAQFTLGLSLPPSFAQTPAAYVAAQISATLLNIHLVQLGDKDLLELGLGQVGLGVQGGQFQGQAGAQAEVHLTPRFSLLLTGAITLTPGQGGLTASPGPFNLGVVYHLPH